MEEKSELKKPNMFLRVGAKGGLYFFSPKGRTIYFMAANHVRDLLEGEREFAVIHMVKAITDGGLKDNG
ncbi:unnamed protein product [marine sediment metagenome]|uniref:Uncharacterized protein n=1 Tax=marine sediment metagenome TaxID=412755 RepID=X1DXN3_9ZZZZ